MPSVGRVGAAQHKVFFRLRWRMVVVRKLQRRIHLIIAWKISFLFINFRLSFDSPRRGLEISLFELRLQTICKHQTDTERRVLEVSSKQTSTPLGKAISINKTEELFTMMLFMAGKMLLHRLLGRIFGWVFLQPESESKANTKKIFIAKASKLFAGGGSGGGECIPFGGCFAFTSYLVDFPPPLALFVDVI